MHTRHRWNRSAAVRSHRGKRLGLRVRGVYCYRSIHDGGRRNGLAQPLSRREWGTRPFPMRLRVGGPAQTQVIPHPEPVSLHRGLAVRRRANPDRRGGPLPESVEHVGVSNSEAKRHWHGVKALPVTPLFQTVWQLESFADSARCAPPLTIVRCRLGAPKITTLAAFEAPIA